MFLNDVDDDDDDSLVIFNIRRGRIVVVVVVVVVVVLVDATSTLDEDGMVDVRGKDRDDPRRVIRPRVVTTATSRPSRTMIYVFSLSYSLVPSFV
jgi:hypothetical protein